MFTFKTVYVYFGDVPPSWETPMVFDFLHVVAKRENPGWEIKNKKPIWDENLVRDFTYPVEMYRQD